MTPVQVDKPVVDKIVVDKPGAVVESKGTILTFHLRFI
jgi:trehalose-6-phosphatase